MARCHRAPCSNGKTFLVYTYVTQENVVKILKVQGARAITWLSYSMRNHLSYHF